MDTVQQGSAEQSQRAKKASLGSRVTVRPWWLTRTSLRERCGRGTSHTTGRVAPVAVKLLAAGDDWEEGRASGRAERPVRKAPPHHGKAEIFCVAILSGEAEGQGW